MNRRIVLAVVLLALALPAIFAVLFMPTEILLMQVEFDWRRHRDPVEFLTRWPESPYQEMAARERRTLPHEQEAGAARATADTIATATDDSHMQL